MKPAVKIPPTLGLFLGILAVSTASLFIRFAQRDASSLVIAAGRLTIASLLLFPFVIKRVVHDIKGIDRKLIGFLILAGLFLGLHFATWITSLEYTSVASSVVLVTTAPLWVALLSPIFLKEKLSFWVILGLIVSLAGSVIVGINGLCTLQNGQFSCVSITSFCYGRAFWGNVLALLGAFLSGGYLMVGRRVRSHFSLPTYSYLVYSVAALVLLITVVITRAPLRGISIESWAWIALLAIVPQLIGHSTFNYFLKYLSAAFVSIALLGEPVGTVILTFIFLHESPSLLEIGGGVLILTGIFIATRANHNGNQNPASD